MSNQDGHDNRMVRSENKSHEEDVAHRQLEHLLGADWMRLKETAGTGYTAADSQPDTAPFGGDDRALRRHQAGKRQYCYVQLPGSKHADRFEDRAPNPGLQENEGKLNDPRLEAEGFRGCRLEIDRRWRFARLLAPRCNTLYKILLRLKARGFHHPRRGH